MNWQNILSDIVYPSMSGLLTTLLGLLVFRACDAFARWASSHKYSQAAGVIVDAIKASWSSKIKPSLQNKLADGKMTDQEWVFLREEIKEEARQIAMERLKDLRGFAPKNIGKWVEVQLDASLGELLGRVLPGEESETDPLANTPASDQ